MLNQSKVQKLPFQNVTFVSIKYGNFLGFDKDSFPIVNDKFWHFKFCYNRKKIPSGLGVLMKWLFMICKTRLKAIQELLIFAQFSYICSMLSAMYFFLAKLRRQTQRFYFTPFYLKAKLHVKQHLSTFLARKWDESLGKRYLSMEAQIKVNKLFKLPNKTNSVCSLQTFPYYTSF